jgi:hypothetical protein
VLWRRPSYYYGNELVCEVSVQQLREDVQSDGQKSDLSGLLLERRCETLRLNVQHAGDSRLAQAAAMQIALNGKSIAPSVLRTVIGPRIHDSLIKIPPSSAT